MSTSVVPPPRWPTPPVTSGRQLVELRKQYPRATCWYGPKSRLWLAVPVGATRLVQAPTAAGLAVQLAEHYRRYLEIPRPVSPQRSVSAPGGVQAGVAVSPHPMGSRAATPVPRRGRGRHARNKYGQWFSGLVGALPEMGAL